MAKALAFMAAAVVGLPGCSPFGGGAFKCTDDLDCKRGGAGDGQCELTGFCSFESATCGGGRVYGEHSGDLSNQCVGGSGPDAQEPDATLPEAGEVCFGMAPGFVQPCFSVAPSGTIVLSGNIDTNGSMCSTAVSNTTACVIAADMIQVPAANVVTASGTRPLVLVGTTSIEIAGTLDVASHHGPVPPGPNDQYTTARIGPAADSTACGAPGAPGDDGGGAGGTFGGLGGAGGIGSGVGVGAGGTAPAVVAISTLRGGCPGQAGQPDTAGMTTPGAGGHSGGVVWLIANGSITIAGVLNASGEGGHPGTTAGSGGGGGGSGGMIGLDAPTITNNGTVFANAGAGGEGSGNTTRGAVGTEATTAAPAGPPVSGSNGGDGGAGGAGGTAGGTAAGGTAGNAGAPPMGQTFGGGGGGGGTGIIKVFRGALGGTYSPNPS